jgi:hypothetical protein
MYKGVTILYAVRLVSVFEDSMEKSYFGWIIGEKEDERAVLQKKRKFYRLASVKKDLLFFFPQSRFILFYIFKTSYINQF